MDLENIDIHCMECSVVVAEMPSDECHEFLLWVMMTETKVLCFGCQFETDYKIAKGLDKVVPDRSFTNQPPPTNRGVTL